MMDRYEEYKALIQELEPTPTELDSVVDRAEARRKRARKQLRLFGIPVGSFAACFILFIFLVNLFPPFAYACGQIPPLKKLAQAVAWSPSLSAAVENEFVQPIEESQRAENIKATVHYVIVDRKQINVFYSLDYEENDYADLQAAYDFGSLNDWCGTVGTGMLEPGKVQRINLNFMEADVPDSLDFTLRLYQTHQMEPVEFTDSEKIAVFTFQLKFDPYFTEQGEQISVDTSFELDGQSFMLTDVELYPTHLRINLESDPKNTAYLEGLQLYLENEDGEKFRKSLNGISASGSPDGKGMSTFWLDSPYFRHSEHLTLYIKSASWNDPEQLKIQVNLRNNTCTGLPKDIQFGGVQKISDGYNLNFIHPYTEANTMYNQFCNLFWDQNGQMHDIHSVSHTIGYVDAATGKRVKEDACFTESLLLPECPEGIVYLNLLYHRTTDFKNPVSIIIR